MIKAVFFDLYHTLVRYEPPQEVLEAEALKDFGIDARPEVLRRPLVMAAEYIYQEIARRPLSQRSPEEKTAIYARYQEIILEEAGIETSQKLVYGLLAKMKDLKSNLVLFDDVAPLMTSLKERGITIGLISNIEQDMTSTFDSLGLSGWLDVIVTSLEAGMNKPHPEIFREALRRGGVKPDEALYVGDQYQVDVLGANGAGMKGILLDRAGYFESITDSPRIRSLAEITDYL